ncbi:23S rRNA (adenine(1618)-N(6))-methyltransferase RlmF [Aurantibacter crassamenti]|uniref:23S rRNA (adenine(1618)-N(6))-methyltransferase RlmF n=1 Tax=Aurantibacter crassamenti TaxID=1837375 RepID=UPI00193A2B37|nr:23S rRNA (adenine(1618)-N(6))-methyltransferase RlmF [Aurantibacter crassamenti]MBM1104534.1 23S rRNA (adenine(1618)-N(6))-methyltransferase RlmF [Aurantibacter crassamenti]
MKLEPIKTSGKSQKIKTRLHARNKNREQYDLSALIKVCPELKNHLKPNKLGVDSVDFSSPVAVKLLNKSILNHYYGIKKWDFPDENLCPPIPGRADYVHHIADLLGKNNLETIPTGDTITCLDVGVGASCIYPIIGVTEYGWRFIGSDVDSESIASAKQIVNSNPLLEGKVDCRLQKNSRDFFYGILKVEDKIDIVISNPPFHSSIEEAQKGTRRKIKNLSGKKVKTPELNFSGISTELIYKGGESKFIQDMVWESRKFAKNCYWFSTLVSKESNLKGIRKVLEKVEANQIKTIPMGTGNKSSRIVAWTFLSPEEQKEWRETRWKTPS